MTERVRREFPCDSRLFFCFAKACLDCGNGLAAIMHDGAVLFAVFVIPLAKGGKKLSVDGHHAIGQAALFGAKNGDHPEVPIHLGPREAEELLLAWPEARVIGERQGPDKMSRCMRQDLFGLGLGRRQDDGVVSFGFFVAGDRVVPDEPSCRAGRKVENGLDVAKLPVNGCSLNPGFQSLCHILVQPLRRDPVGVELAEVIENNGEKFVPEIVRRGFGQAGRPGFIVGQGQLPKQNGRH